MTDTSQDPPTKKRPTLKAAIQAQQQAQADKKAAAQTKAQQR